MSGILSRIDRQSHRHPFKSANLSTGQKSSRINKNGSVTSIDLESSPAIKRTATRTYLHNPGFCEYRKYANIVKNAKKLLRTFLRSAAHATDSTAKGCTPKTAATNALGQIAPVIFFNIKKSRITLAM